MGVPLLSKHLRFTALLPALAILVAVVVPLAEPPVGVASTANPPARMQASDRSADDRTREVAGAEGVARLRISPVALSVVVAILTVAIQLLLKLGSRQPLPGKRHGLVREDLVWWLDWVVAAVVACLVLGLSTARDGGSFDAVQFLILGFVFILGLGGIPNMVRLYGYDLTSEPPALRTLMGIVVPNLAGALILMGTISSGAQLGG